jgi:methylmalonyl-CoA mutase
MSDKKTYKAPASTFTDWQKAAEGQLRGKPLESLNATTPEGLEQKALYTAADLERLQYTDTLPGLEPYCRGV